MISVCIPVFNTYITGLVNALDAQCRNENIRYEIILIDDASDELYRCINRELAKYQNVTYIELQSNIGRSAIRNHFLHYATFDYLLFLDGDSQLISGKFIGNYIQLIDRQAEVICGGRSYSRQLKDRKLRLRWKYGMKRECTPAGLRSIKPYHSFLSNNFLIKKQVFSKILFDEKITNYGHEDTLFGFHLMKNGIRVVHIENSVQHDFNETTTDFLLKTEQSIKNLNQIYLQLGKSGEFSGMVRLLEVYERLKKLRLTGLIGFLFQISSGAIKAALKTGIIWLFLLDFYKLGLLCRISRKNSYNQKKQILI